MKTYVCNMEDKEKYSENIKAAADIIKSGDLVAFPTETVYGLGADGTNPSAVRKIFEAKGRPGDNPLILHIADIKALDIISRGVSEKARRLMKVFWPGPITFIVPKSPVVPVEVSAGLDTVGVRFPSSSIAQDFINGAGVPIAAPSANRSGRPSPTDAKAVYEDLQGRIKMILDGGSTEIGLESTVVDVSGEVPIILRPGGISLEELQLYAPETRLDDYLISASDSTIPRSPGQKYRHYAPKAPMRVYRGERQKVVNEIIKEIDLKTAEGLKVGVLCTEESKDFYRNGFTVSMGSVENPNSIGKNLFSALRAFDGYDVDLILAEAVNERGIGYAIMNRIKKACGGEVINL